MSTLPQAFVSPEEYREREQRADVKSEYFQGEIFAMAGASPAHTLISASLLANLYPQLRRAACRIAGSDLRVVVRATGLQTYPDLVVVCQTVEYFDSHQDSITNPTLLAEVLSPSTEDYDRGKKFEHYRKIPSLQQYLVIAQDRLHVELYSRTAEGDWLLKESALREERVDLSSIGCSLSISQIYEQLDLDGG